jgi:DNA polymerase III delta prime subunit
METGYITTSLSLELDWLSEVIDLATSTHVLNLNHNNPYDISAVLALQEPVLEDDDPYTVLVQKHGLDKEERLCLILALAVHVRPQLLDIFLSKNSNYEAVCTEFGGYIEAPHRGVIPTAETLLFLITGRDLAERARLAELFSADHTFTEDQIFRFERKPNMPFYSCKLMLDDEIVQQVLYGKVLLPSFGENFPAQSLTTEMEWEDMVLQQSSYKQLSEVEDWLACETALMQIEELRKRIKPGYRVLFYGPPGTGKTLAATLLGKNTAQPVFRIDLSQVVSKYIGETEKNLSKLFNKAANKDWILFFDEADALFGKRTKTDSSNDRYANQEVAYLLQRIEAFPGLVILASNLKTNIDQAFLRRFQSIVHFPYPEAAERLELWTKACPVSLPFAVDIDLEEIAGRYELTGSHIANIVQTCCLQAITTQVTEITKDILSAALKKEFGKEERIFNKL